MKNRHLKGKGVFDYDYIHDVLFFKTKNREYASSVEFGNMVFDIDSENFIVGIQIFEASKFLGIDKMYLRKIPKWQFNAVVHDGIVEIRLVFQISIRNKVIEKNPIIQQPIDLPNSELECIAIPISK